MEGTVCCNLLLQYLVLVSAIWLMLATLSASTSCDLKMELRLLKEGQSGGPSMQQTSGWWVRFQPKILEKKEENNVNSRIYLAGVPDLPTLCIRFMCCRVLFFSDLKHPRITYMIYIFVYFCSANSLSYMFSLGRR